jgi:glycine dehydrogenase subunit 1
MSYIALSDKDKREMLARVGVAAPADLFHCIPEAVRLKKLLDLPPAMAEPELDRHMTGIAAKNTYGGYLSFLGAGVYDHFIPSVVDSLSSRTEFVTPYTPYQPEMSQGTLQSIFEYQSLICQLTGMDVSNASLYDGAMAAAEAVLMIHRLTGRKRVLLAGSLHPQYLETIRTYTHSLGRAAGSSRPSLRPRWGPTSPACWCNPPTSSASSRTSKLAPTRSTPIRDCWWP